MFNIRTVDLDKLNSLTKYPSIPTYHVMGDKGILTEEVQVKLNSPIYGSEKVDGCNVRLVFCGSSIIVGSREDFLWEHMDVIGNPSMGIVEAMKPIVVRIADRFIDPFVGRADHILTTWYGELYGKNIGSGAKNYSKTGNVGFRLFDVVIQSDWDEILAMPIEKIAAWRENGGQAFRPVNELANIAHEVGIAPVPYLFEMPEIPTTHEAIYKFMTALLPQTCCALDAGLEGRAEGIVVRSADRKSIAKIRFEDYERTFKKRGLAREYHFT